MAEQTVICVKCQRRIPANYPICSHCNARQPAVNEGYADDIAVSYISPTEVEESQPLRFLSLGMVSGTRLEISAILLYRESFLQDATTLRMEGAQKLQGVRTGLGFIGDLGYVIVAGAILGMIEKSLSDSAAREGWRLLERADETLLMARQNGAYFAINSINKIDLAIPEYWSAFRNGVRYIYNQDPMMTVKLRDGSVTAISWDKVESYSVATEVTPSDF